MVDELKKNENDEKEEIEKDIEKKGKEMKWRYDRNNNKSLWWSCMAKERTTQISW